MTVMVILLTSAIASPYAQEKTTWHRKKAERQAEKQGVGTLDAFLK